MDRNGGNNRRRASGRGNRRDSQVGVKNARSRLPNQIILKPSYTAPYKFSRSFTLGNLPKSSADQGYAYPFALNQVPSSNEFTTLFDKYRITMVDLTFSYNYLGSTTSASQQTVELYPALNLFMDDDDAAIPTSKSDVQERMSVQRVSFAPMRQTISVTIRPRWVQSRGGTSTNLAPVNSWIDMSTPAVQHYGVKLWADGYNSGNPSSIAVSGVMHFECNNVR
jgi:hypothetical protein